MANEQQLPGGPQNPWAAILALLGQQSQQHSPMDFANADLTRLQGLRNDPQGDANKGYVPGQNGAMNPFSNGFFMSGASQMTPEARLASQGQNATNQWAQMGQVAGVDAGKLQGLNQQVHDTSMNNLHPNFTPRPQVQQPTPFSVGPFQHGLPGGGFEQMNNPNLPDAQKYQSGNFATVLPGHSTLPPGAVAGDGKNVVRRPFAGFSTSPAPSPWSSFK